MIHKVLQEGHPVVRRSEHSATKEPNLTEVVELPYRFSKRLKTKLRGSKLVREQSEETFHEDTEHSFEHTSS